MIKESLLVFAFIFCFGIHSSYGAEKYGKKIISYNIWNGFDFGKDDARRQRLQKWMAEQKPDVVALQELCKYTPGKLAEDAKSWGHNYSLLLKTTGYPVGITSNKPILLKERIMESMHHGCLHAETQGVDFFIVHLSPHSYLKRYEEAENLIEKASKVQQAGHPVILLGDFNSHSPLDGEFYKDQPLVLKNYQGSDKNNDHVTNLVNGNLEFGVISKFMGAGFQDPFYHYTHGLKNRITFPTMVFAGEKGKTKKSLRARGERIDYMLLSPDLSVFCEKAGVIHSKETHTLSDHYPIYIYLSDEKGCTEK